MELRGFDSGILYVVFLRHHDPVKGVDLLFLTSFGRCV